jgi:HAD superfamily hydrolase (TIGR01509 family)
MNKKEYSIIVFDLGNVLLPFDYNISFNKLEKVEKGLGQKFLDRYMENYETHRSFERGTIPDDEFLNIMLGYIDNKTDKQTMIDAYSKIFKVNEDAVALLPQLKKKFKLILLSNTNSIHQKYGWGGYKFLRHFDKLILSHEVGAVKPEEKIYKKVETFTQMPSAQHIFIDDISEYVEGAKKMGWDAVQFTNYEQLVKNLKEREIL